MIPGEAVVGEPDLRSYMQVLWRRKWTIALSVILVTGAAMAFSFLQAKKYTAIAEVLLQPSNSGNPLLTANGGVSQDLTPTDVQTEVQIMTSAPVEAAVSKTLGVYPAPKVSVTPVGQTNVVDIAATMTSGRQAARIANAYANSYIDFKRNAALQSVVAAEQQIQARISDLDSQITALGSGASSSQRDALLAQEATFKSQLAELQVNSSLLSGGAELITPALAPTSPSSPRPKRNVGVAVIVGLILGVGLAFLLEYLDDSVRSQEDMLRVASDLPVLALVPAVEGWKDRRSTMVVSLARPKSPAAEAYRSLRTSIQFMDINRPLRRLVLTSASATEGKTTTLTNLAVTLAEAGKRVIVVCCDLRRPRIHEFFGLSNETGFTSVLLGTSPLHGALQPVEEVKNLTLLASGPVPPNPSELLSSPRASELLDILATSYDMVLLDTPPVLPVTDAAVLSRHADGVAVVVSAGVTTRKQLGRAFEVLGHVNAPIVGVILNGLTDQSSYGYSYRYSYAYTERNGNGTNDAPVGPASSRLGS
ncbi:MAG TPA: polysaccharide biosynthesis tyrosine autokinase [Acidimicrobiales bacterium]|nr:polysaccharide biosynthesis tyrosine autokinase [Acidimicrobiales bacterium]